MYRLLQFAGDDLSGNYFEGSRKLTDVSEIFLKAVRG
jgi:hypothetical protein